MVVKILDRKEEEERGDDSLVGSGAVGCWSADGFVFDIFLVMMLRWSEGGGMMLSFFERGKKGEGAIERVCGTRGGPFFFWEKGLDFGGFWRCCGVRHRLSSFTCFNGSFLGNACGCVQRDYFGTTQLMHDQPYGLARV